MFSNHRSTMRIQNAVLIFLATLIASVIFMVDLHTDSTVAVASLYALVILYSWLLPGKFASIYVAAACTILTIISAIQSEEMAVNASELSKMNLVISLVVIWICVTLVFIAQSSFSSLKDINQKLSDNSMELLEKVIELDKQQEELATNKRQLELMNEDLRVKNRELERFSNIASHDLQEPLRTIGNMTQLIAKKYYSNFDDQGKQMMDYVTSATNRMANLIKGLLEFSRIGNKRETEWMDCHDMVNTILLDLDAVLKAAKGNITIKELPSIRGNPVELRMLFQNLISNALKFRKADVTPAIEVFATDRQTHVEFCVKDNGIGIEPEYYEKIFHIFQRLHTSDVYEGTGLGLAYCRKIVELHGGKIWVDSAIGTGSSFYFTLMKVR